MLEHHLKNLNKNASYAFDNIKRMLLIKSKKFLLFLIFPEPRQKILINSVKEHAPDSQKKKLSDF